MKKKEVIPDKKKVFISYRRDTSSVMANSLAKELKDKFEVYLDKNDKQPGGYLERINDYIDNKCTHFILVIDKETFKFDGNNNVLRSEIEHALQKLDNNQKFAENSFKIIPIVHNGYQKPESTDNDLEKRISDLNWIEYDETKETFEEFIPDVLEMLGYDESEKEKKKKKKKRLLITLRAIAAVALLVLSVFGGTRLQQYNTSKASKIPESPKLIFAGGGSVANLINEIVGDSVFINKYNNSYYLDLPSENAWSLLAEEVMINHTSDSVYNKFYPVCLSALEAPDSVFYKMVSKKEFMENGTIISYRLKHDDTLKVYTNQNIGHDGIISIGELSNRIKTWYQDKSVKIYITQENSGTYFKYQELFKDTVDIDSCKKQLNWYNGKLLVKNLDNNYIVLTSQYYTPKDIRRLNSIMVVDNSGVKITKPMYLYFAGYTNPKQSDITIPEEMVDFMKHFGITIKSRMHQDSLKVVTPIDALINWETSFQNQGKVQNDKRKR